MIPGIGRIVQYMLDQDDVNAINSLGPLDRERASKHILGQVIPVLVTNCFGELNEDTVINGQGFVDGNFTVWLTNRKQGNGPGYWRDPRS